MAGRLPYVTCCVESDAESIIDMVDQAVEVSLQTFLRRCKTEAWQQSMGYITGAKNRQGLRLHRDYHVRYYRSKFQSRLCYFAVHSAIEYVFAA